MATYTKRQPNATKIGMVMTRSKFVELMDSSAGVVAKSVKIAFTGDKSSPYKDISSYLDFQQYHRALSSVLSGDLGDRDVFNTAINLTDDNPSISPEVNVFLYAVLRLSTGEDARGIVDEHYVTKDGRRALLQLHYEAAPGDIVSTTILEEDLFKTVINASTIDPATTIKHMRLKGLQLSTDTENFSDKALQRRIIGALGHNYSAFKQKIAIDGTSYSNAHQLQVAIRSYWTATKAQFTTQPLRDTDSKLAALTAEVHRLRQHTSSALAACGASGSDSDEFADTLAAFRPAHANTKSKPRVTTLCRICANGERHFLDSCPLVKEIQKQKGIVPMPPPDRSAQPYKSNKSFRSEISCRKSSSDRKLENGSSSGNMRFPLETLISSRKLHCFLAEIFSFPAVNFFDSTENPQFTTGNR